MCILKSLNGHEQKILVQSFHLRFIIDLDIIYYYYITTISQEIKKRLVVFISLQCDSGDTISTHSSVQTAYKS